MQHAQTPLLQDRIGFREGRLYVVTAVLVMGNLILPMVVHGWPGGGKSLLPILFFTLVGGWRFGLSAALLTACLSPLINHLLTGMPEASVLPRLILESMLLGILAAFVGRRSRGTLSGLGMIVALHQSLVLLPVILASGALAGLHALQMRFPGILLQIVGGFLVLRLLASILPVRPFNPHET
jgi:hypothetical protein